jgi:hypothetical protein
MNTYNTTIDQAKKQEELEAIKAYHREWRLKNKEKLKEQSKAYYEKNKEQAKKSNKDWKQKNKERLEEYLAEYKIKNKEYIKEYHRAYRERNEEKLKEYHKNKRESNKELNKEQRKQRYAQNRDKIREQDRLYYQQNKERIKAQVKEYAKNNKDKINERTLKKLKTNKSFKLRCVLSTRIAKAIKDNNGKKSLKTQELLGCSVEHARLHIESLWLPGMSWDNYSLTGWHIDHIKPCASFDLTDIEEQKRCFHYTNLQPLWAKENRAKSSIHDGKMHHYPKSNPTEP